MPPTEPIWVTPEEAAKEHGVSAQAIRRWARAEKIVAKQNPGRRWKILSIKGDQP